MLNPSSVIQKQKGKFNQTAAYGGEGFATQDKTLKIARAKIEFQKTPQKLESKLFQDLLRQKQLPEFLIKNANSEYGFIRTNLEGSREHFQNQLPRSKKGLEK